MNKYRQKLSKLEKLLPKFGIFSLGIEDLGIDATNTNFNAHTNYPDGNGTPLCVNNPDPDPESFYLLTLLRKAIHYSRGAYLLHSEFPMGNL